MYVREALLFILSDVWREPWERDEGLSLKRISYKSTILKPPALNAFLRAYKMIGDAFDELHTIFGTVT